MLKIRLQRIGRKHEPVFRLVLTDSKNSTKSGRSLEILGNYDSRRGDQAALKAERINYWLSKGAQASGTVHNLLISKKIIEGKKVNVLPLKKAIVKDAPVVEATTPVVDSTPPTVSEEVSAPQADETAPAVESPSAPQEEVVKEESQPEPVVVATEETPTEGTS